MKKIFLSVALLLTSFANSMAFAHCNDFVGTWVGATSHEDPLHLLTCHYKTHATVIPSTVNTAYEVTLDYSLESGKIKRVCKKSVPTATYIFQCKDSNKDTITLHRTTGKGLTIPPQFHGVVRDGQVNVMGKLSGSKVEMVLKPAPTAT